MNDCPSWPVLQGEQHGPTENREEPQPLNGEATPNDNDWEPVTPELPPHLIGGQDLANEVNDLNLNQSPSSLPSQVNLAAMSHLTTTPSAPELDNKPQTLQGAMKRPDWQLWEEAIVKELESHQVNHTWSITRAPTKANIVGCCWVFKVKRKGDGTINKYKARFVAQGFSQKHGINYEETFAPVVKLKTLQMLMILALQLGITIYQMDVETAYLNGDIDANIYMRLPPIAPEMKVPDAKRIPSTGRPNDLTPMVCKLHKFLYGLKQAGQNWYQKADLTLLSMGFKRNDHNPALYSKKVGTRPPLLLTLYVDDVLIFAQRKVDAEEVMSQLRSHFKMTGGDKLSYILGIQVSMTESSIHLSQASYINQLLLQFGLKDANLVHTPINPGANLSEGAKLDVEQHSLYRTIVGSVLYVATCTRPDIAFTVQKLS